MQRTVLLSEFCPSVRPSVRCLYCNKTKQRTANILIPHETAITQVFWHQQWLVGDPPFLWNLRSKWPTPFFRYLLRLRRYERKSVEVGVFRRGWVTLNADFRGKGASPTNHSWYQSSRVIALSCGIKISAVRHLVLSQSTRQTDRQNYDSEDRPCICSRGKNCVFNFSLHCLEVTLRFLRFNAKR